ncbi:MAG: LamB/YcsF family protein [Cyclobacteriaceae bacterium]|nr:LamB/YcsF family protein [Cyclobacteriaceae bacterium]
MTIDINCDMGEGMPNDADIIPYISSANIACGYHAGNETTMRSTIDLCLKQGVAIGAHPGFNDKENFGRKPVQLSADEMYQLVWKQLEIIQAICKEKHAKLHHVKLHGALYNMAAKDKSISKIAAQAVKDFDPELIFYGLSGSVMITEANALGLKTANEVFADRNYQRDGTLTPRTMANAMIEDTTTALAQVMQMVAAGSVRSADGNNLPIKADTICVHGDEPRAPELVKLINKGLRNSGYTIATV